LADTWLRSDTGELKALCDPKILVLELVEVLKGTVVAPKRKLEAGSVESPKLKALAAIGSLNNGLEVLTEGPKLYFSPKVFAAELMKVFTDFVAVLKPKAVGAVLVAPKLKAVVDTGSANEELKERFV